MGIQIKTVRVSGFRCLENVEVDLSKVTLLLGINNSGKTSLIKALELALGDYSRYLSDEDFYIGIDGKTHDQIVVDVLFVPSVVDDTKPQTFSRLWRVFFEDSIQSEADDKQFVAFRTVVKQESTKTRYEIKRYSLIKWEKKEIWLNHMEKNQKKLSFRLNAIQYFSIKAQRDIFADLKERSSFIGRVLSGINYDEADIENLETMIAEINNAVVNKCEHLGNLKLYLDELSQTIDVPGETELTPLPRNVRDLSKGFSINFKKNGEPFFSMEYHGMGTRSWASLLTVKAFVEITKKAFEDEYEAFFPIVAIEEPENHLHPNAQRTLYQQISSIQGQVIISTHSPYIAGQASLEEIRYLKGMPVTVHEIDDSLEKEEKRRLEREVIHSRGELLFSKILVLFEGETEEQMLPALFEKYTNFTPFSLGINFISVHGSGAKYKPYFHLAKSFDIPVFVFSDGESRIIKDLSKYYCDIFGIQDITHEPNVVILDGTNIEGYLVNNGFQEIVEASIERCYEKENYIDRWIRKNRNHIPTKEKRSSKFVSALPSQPIYMAKTKSHSAEKNRKIAILEILGRNKPMYAKAITDNLILLPPNEYPDKFKELFDRIKDKVGTL